MHHTAVTHNHRIAPNHRQRAICFTLTRVGELGKGANAENGGRCVRFHTEITFGKRPRAQFEGGFAIVTLVWIRCSQCLNRAPEASASSLTTVLAPALRAREMLL